MVAPADDDQVLETPRDEQLAIVQEAQVPGAQEGSFAGPRLVRAEGLRRRLRPRPVAARHARAPHPHLAHPVRRAFPQRRRIHDQHPLRRRAPPAPHQPVASLRLRFDHRPLPQRPGIDRPHHRRLRRLAPRHHQRRLGQPVARKERPLPEPALRERLAEGAQRLGTHRLGPVEGDLPVAQVQLRTLLGPHRVHAQLVGEVGPAAAGGPVARDRLQPPRRTLDERHRREQRRPVAGEQRLEDAADQPHVVVWRQPDDRARLRRIAAEALDDGEVVEEVAVADHHPLGRGRGTRGVLEEGQRVAGCPRVLPRLGLVRGDVLGGQPAQPTQLRRVGEQPLRFAKQLAGGQRQRGRAVLDDAPQARVGPVAARRVGGDRGHPGVEAAEEGGDVLQPRRIEQERPLPARAERLEAGGDRTGAQVELAVGDVPLLHLPVEQKGVRDPVRVVVRAEAEELYERGGVVRIRHLSAKRPGERRQEGTEPGSCAEGCRSPCRESLRSSRRHRKARRPAPRSRLPN